MIELCSFKHYHIKIKIVFASHDVSHDQTTTPQKVTMAESDERSCHNMLIRLIAPHLRFFYAQVIS